MVREKWNPESIFSCLSRQNLNDIIEGSFCLNLNTSSRASSVYNSADYSFNSSWKISNNCRGFQIWSLNLKIVQLKKTVDFQFFHLFSNLRENFKLFEGFSDLKLQAQDRRAKRNNVAFFHLSLATPKYCCQIIEGFSWFVITISRSSKKNKCNKALNFGNCSLSNSGRISNY